MGPVEAGWGEAGAEAVGMGAENGAGRTRRWRGRGRARWGRRGAEGGDGGGGGGGANGGDGAPEIVKSKYTGPQLLLDAPYAWL